MPRAIRSAVLACGLVLAPAATATAAADDSPPDRSAPSATLSVDVGKPGSEVDVWWLDEWNTSTDVVEVSSRAFEQPVRLSWSGRQYHGKARLRAQARPGSTTARVVSHGGRDVRVKRFWTAEEPSVADEVRRGLTSHPQWGLVAGTGVLGGGLLLAAAIRRRPGRSR
ncbi:hypothetical protein AB0G54_03630 [Streptomyces yokosukanensis]|uniref:hypothetical protein n=1 Tax=Streptomyces yokosukanensis TaxID=67386 RepID=UPI0034262D9F